MIYSPEQNILDNLPLSPRSGFGVCYNFHVCKSAAQVTDVLPEVVDTVFSSKEKKGRGIINMKLQVKTAKPLQR